MIVPDLSRDCCRTGRLVPRHPRPRLQRIIVIADIVPVNVITRPKPKDAAGRNWGGREAHWWAGSQIQGL